MRNKRALRREYMDLKDDERNGEKGKELLSQIKAAGGGGLFALGATTDKVKPIVGKQ